MREVRAQEMELKVTEGAKAVLARKGWDPQFGARPLRRAIQRMVEDELAEEMLKGNFGSGDHILGRRGPRRSGQNQVREDPDGRAARRSAAHRNQPEPSKPFARVAPSLSKDEKSSATLSEVEGWH